MTGTGDRDAASGPAVDGEGGLAGSPWPDERLDALLTERARQLAEPERPAHDRAAFAPMLTVELSSERYGLELARLAAIAPLRQVLPVPGGPPELLGLVGARGEIWAAFSLRRLIGIAEAEDSTGFVVLLRHAWRRVGLRVDAVEGTVAASHHLSPGSDRGAGGASSLIRATTPDRVILIDLDALWSHPSIAEVLRHDA